jgi:excisionase family DNA binding protein
MQNNMPKPNDELLTQAELAQLLKVSKRTIQEWRKRGDCPFVPIGYRTVRFLKSSVLATCSEIETRGQSLPASKRQKPEAQPETVAA